MKSLLRLQRLAMAFLLTALAVAHASAQKSSSGPTYAHDIRPILQARCVVCHNRDTLAAVATSGGLDLSTFEALKKGVTSIKAGDVSILTGGKQPGGPLIERLSTTNPTRLMPRGGPPLPPEQIALFKKWISSGAPEGREVSSGHAAAAAVLPMPAPAGLQDVSFNTLLKATPDLVAKPTPKDLAVAFALKVGPVPGITALAYSPDGTILAVGGYRAVTFWSTKTGQPIACITHLDGAVQSLAFRPDGIQLAIAGGRAGLSGDVRIVDTKSLATVGRLQGHTEVVLSVAWNADGSRIATGSQDKTARIWEWPSGKELKNFKDHGDAVTSVCFSPDGKSLYTACMDHNLRRFDVDKGSLTRTFTGHNDAVTAMAVSLDGKRLVSSGIEPNMRWWNTESGDITNNNGGNGGQVNEIVLSKDGKLLVSVSADKTARVWDANSTGQRRALEGSTDWVYAAAISPDSKFTAAAGADGVVRIWETANGRLRLMLISWPQEKAPLPEWLAITPEGYYDGSAAWCALLKPSLVGNAPATPQLTAWVKTLRQPDNLLKSWQGVALDAAKPK